MCNFTLGLPKVNRWTPCGMASYFERRTRRDHRQPGASFIKPTTSLHHLESRFKGINGIVAGGYCKLKLTTPYGRIATLLLMDELRLLLHTGSLDCGKTGKLSYAQSITELRDVSSSKDPEKKEVCFFPNVSF